MSRAKPLTICFNAYTFGFRGTEIAIYDYANKNETILGNKSIIVVPKSAGHSHENQPLVMDKFMSRFEIYFYSNVEDLDDFCEKKRVDAVYFLKYGTRSVNPYIVPKVPSLIHCVYKIDDPHGTVYASISESVSVFNSEEKNYSIEKYKNMIASSAESSERKLVPFVPHMIELPENTDDFRKELKIPQSAIVFGRHGGKDTFFLPGIQAAIADALRERKDVYFLFMPMPTPLAEMKNERLIELPITADNRVKRKFINTCDAMIHAQILGETQGLSVLEFSYCDKPVITWNGGRAMQHLINLDEKAILYRNLYELKNILVRFDKETYNDYSGKDIVEKYLPKNVMAKFNDVFLSKIGK